MRDRGRETGGIDLLNGKRDQPNLLALYIRKEDNGEKNSSYPVQEWSVSRMKTC
jgi:hypothetical protein